MLKPLFVAAAATTLLSLAACDGGSAEKTGENMDSAVEEATQGAENLGDGPLERAGEQIDEATDHSNADPDAADAVHDAADGNPSTNP